MESVRVNWLGAWERWWAAASPTSLPALSALSTVCHTTHKQNSRHQDFVEFCVFISSIFLYDLNSLTALHYWITQEYDTCQDKHQLHYLIDKRNIGSLIILRRLRRKFMLFQGRCANWAWCSFRKLQLQCKEKMVSPVQRAKGESKWQCAEPGCKACQISRECSEPAQ